MKINPKLLDIDNVTDCFKLRRKSATVQMAANTIMEKALDTVTAITGYTVVSILPFENGYGDQWIVSYSFYGGRVYAMIHNKYSSALTSTLVYYILYIRTDIYDKLLT